MDNRDNRDLQALLSEMAVVQRRSQRLSLIITVVIVLMAAALIVSLLLLVPKLSATLDHAGSTLSDTQQIIQRISLSLDELDSVGESLEELTGEGGESLKSLIDTLNTVNLDSLTEAIQRFNSVLEGLANFRLFG